MPNVFDALRNVNVANTVKTAFENTQSSGFEYGGWIKHNATTGAYTATSKTDNSPDSVMLSSATLIAQQQAGGWQIVADYHCHPGTNRAACKPSAGDIANSKNKGYTMLVFTNPNDDNMADFTTTKQCSPSAAPFSIAGESVGKYAVMWEIIKRK